MQDFKLVNMSLLLALCLVFLDAVPSAATDLCTTSTYQRHLRALKCNQTYGQQLVDLYLNCGYNQMALMESMGCGTSLEGEFCFDVADRSQQYQVAVDSLCFDLYGKPSCSNSCQQALWNFREKVGCCINNLYNASDNPLSNDRTASNILWMACEVPPIDGFCNSTLRYEEVYDTMVCVYDEVIYRKSKLDCSPNYGQVFVDLFHSCGYSLQLRYAVNICGVNSENRYCFELINDGNSLAEEVNEHCVETTDIECPLACKVVLDSYRRQLGCCLNNLYNDEDNSFFGTTSPALWTTCSVTRPRFCKTTISMRNGSPAEFTFSIFLNTTLILFVAFVCM